MKNQLKILPWILSLLLAVCLFASATADAPYAEITASGKTYRLTIADCRMKTRNMYMVTVQGYNIAEDSEGGGFTVDEEHLPFFIAGTCLYVQQPYVILFIYTSTIIQRRCGHESHNNHTGNRGTEEEVC